LIVIELNILPKHGIKLLVKYDINEWFKNGTSFKLCTYIAGFFPPFYADVNVFSFGDVKQYLTLLQIMHENNSVSK